MGLWVVSGVACVPEPGLAESDFEDDAPETPVSAFCGTTPVRFRVPTLDVHSDLVQFLNELPRPLTLPCAVAALPRPLGVMATDSVISLQPAFGRLNPRIFLRTPGSGLVLSVTLVGEMSTHLETAEAVEHGVSVKGDLPFPRTGPINEREFFSDILASRGTSCGFCHAGEYEARRVDGVPVFASRALMPLSSQLMHPTSIRGLADGCSVGDGSLRCQLLRAIFRSPTGVTKIEWQEGTRRLGE
jgi:hypothetical protein